jgi:hypothetical protein
VVVSVTVLLVSVVVVVVGGGTVVTTVVVGCTRLTLVVMEVLVFTTS